MTQAKLDDAECASDAREAFEGFFGHAPAALPGRADLWADWLTTPLGDMIAVADGDGLHLLEFIERKSLAQNLRKLSARAKGRIGLGRTAITDRVEAGLAAYFAGEGWDFPVPLTPHGTEFQHLVWAELRRIPAGETRGYGQIAAGIGRPTASRAVARANATNQIAIVIPCHRVIGADGSLTGYAGGLWRKERLIEIENGRRRFAGT